MTQPQPFIKIHNVSKAYPEGNQVRTVLVDVCETIDRGEIVVILGRSGSGKSTLLNLISGIDTPDAGDIVLDGQIVNRLSERDRTLLRRQRMGFIFQFFNLIPTLTVLENILLPLELNHMLEPHDRQRAMRLLEAVGLADRHSSFPDALSGGEQQRIAMVRSLVHNPDIILADEPTGNLDQETGRQVIHLLDQLVREKRATLVMATHSKEVVGWADRVLQVKAGALTLMQDVAT
jgi:putative ABC transport system ATP-binding protein